MPWNPQGGGGGPWGSGNGGGGGPWGRGGGSGPQPPDLEELLRKGQDRFRQVVPGGFGSGHGFVLVAAVAMVLWLLTGFYRVQPDEKGVVLRFGEYVRSEDSGLHYRLPYPFETVLTPKVTTINRVELGFRSIGEMRGRGSASRDVLEESLMLTGDENIVDIHFSVFWQVKPGGAEAYLFNVRDPEGTVKVAAESAMRDIIGQTPIQSALTEGRAAIEVRTRDLLQKLLDSYNTGIKVTQVQLLKADPPAQVIDAFNDVQRAKADQERLRNEAEAYRNDIIPRARGDAEKLLQDAAAYKEQVVNLAQGEAGRFTSVANAYALAKDVTARRLYLETMEQVLKGTNKVIIDPGAQSGQGVQPYLPLPDLLKRQPTYQPQAQGAPR
jgi:membrane protease subunit HflK